MLARSALAAFTIMPLSALAHPGHESHAASLLGGLAHPLLGLDHVLALAAVGLWAAFLGGRARYMVPGAFVASMICGFTLAVAGVSFPAVEPGIAASVLVLGVLLAAAVRLPLAHSALLVSVFAVLHGHAHGDEFSGSAFTFGVGFIAATLLLHAAGIGLGRMLLNKRLVLVRGLGTLMAAIGLMLFGGMT